MQETRDHQEQRLLPYHYSVKLNKYLLGAIDTEVSKTAGWWCFAIQSVVSGPARLTSLVRNAGSQASAQTYWIRICFFNRILGWFLCTLKGKGREQSSSSRHSSLGDRAVHGGLGEVFWNPRLALPMLVIKVCRAFFIPNAYFILATDTICFYGYLGLSTDSWLICNR